MSFRKTILNAASILRNDLFPSTTCAKSISNDQAREIWNGQKRINSQQRRQAIYQLEIQMMLQKIKDRL